LIRIVLLPTAIASLLASRHDEPAPAEIYTLSLHDALPICNNEEFRKLDFSGMKLTLSGGMALQQATAERWHKVTGCEICEGYGIDRKSTRLNSSHVKISYAVFCLKKKTKPESTA